MAENIQLLYEELQEHPKMVKWTPVKTELQINVYTFLIPAKKIKHFTCVILYSDILFYNVY